jgi:hypothetical protein
MRSTNAGGDPGRRLLRGLLAGALAAAVVLSAAGHASAVELRGRVSAVTGRDVRIELEGDLVPRVGDPVNITFRIPGGPELSVGTWKVSGIEGDAVLATVVTATGTPAVGHAVTIDSPAPGPRGQGSGPSARLAPGAPGTPRAPGPASPQAGSEVAPGSRPWLGAGVVSLDPAIAKWLEAPTDRGAVVKETVPGSPAERSGLVEYDVIVRFDGAPVQDAADLVRRVAATTVGATVEVVVIRAGAERALRVTIGARPPQQ